MDSIPLVIRAMKKHLRHTRGAVLTEISKTRDPFKVLISCILSLRTKDATTEAASERLYNLADTPENMVKLPAHTIEKAIYPVGFYRTKARQIKEICKRLIDEYHGRVPAAFDELMAFKGVGRKTANIVVVYGFNKPGMPVDTHVHRIANRLGWVTTKTPEKTEEALRALVPQRYWKELNNLFVTFGQNVCTPVRPHCLTCSVQPLCAFGKTYMQQLQRLKK